MSVCYATKNASLLKVIIVMDTLCDLIFMRIRNLRFIPTNTYTSWVYSQPNDNAKNTSRRASSYLFIALISTIFKETRDGKNSLLRR